MRFALYQVAPQSFPDANELLLDDLLLLLEDFFDDVDDEVFDALRDDITLVVDELLTTIIIEEAALLLTLLKVEALLLIAIMLESALLFIAALVVALELDKTLTLDVTTAMVELVVCLSPPESLPPPQAVKFMARVIQRIACNSRCREFIAVTNSFMC